MADSAARTDQAEFFACREICGAAVGGPGLNEFLRWNHCQTDQFTKFFAALNLGHEVFMTASGPAVAPPRQQPEDKIPVFRCLTGGSAGKPALVRRTHQSWIVCFLTNSRLWGISSSDRYGLMGGLSHSLSLYAAMEAVHLGAELYLLSGLYPARQIDEMGKRRITILYATPSQISLAFAASSRNRRLQVPSLRLLLVGGSKLQPAHKDAARSLFPNAEIREFYGTSETSFIALEDKDTPDGFVGAAYPGVRVSICRTSGSTGQIRVQSPGQALGYAPGHFGAARWRDGSVVTGDLGELSPSGFLKVLGRADRRIKIADQLVCPEDIEACILEVESVEQAAVLPVADGLRGASLAAFVSVTGGEPQFRRVEAHCRDRLDPGMRPRKFVRVGDWPFLPSGKTDYRALRAMLEN